MATLRFTNLTADETLYLFDFASNAPEIAPGAVYDLEDRDPKELYQASHLAQYYADGKISIEVIQSSGEVAMLALIPVAPLAADSLESVAAADISAVPATFLKAFAAGGGGAPDDVVVFAANSLPFKLRVLDVVFLVATAVGGSSLTVRDEAAGAGTAVASGSSAVAGKIAGALTGNATTVLTPGASKGLFVRRSDNGVAGTVIITYRREV